MAQDPVQVDPKHYTVDYLFLMLCSWYTFCVGKAVVFV